MKSVLQNSILPLTKKKAFWFVVGAAFLLLLYPAFAFAQWEDTVGNAILTFSAGLLYVCGMMLDFAVAKLVLGMGAEIENTAIGVINISWSVIRDFCNLAFIFGFVWIGIRTIMDYESAGTRKFLASLIVAALLINFSLFFTKVIIDVSNAVASEIYSSITSKTFTTLNDQPKADEGAGIAAAFVNAMSLSSVYNKEAITTKTTSAGNVLTYFILAAIFFQIAAFTFAVGAILLVVRYVALIVLMIFSPVLFAASIFSKTAGFSKMLWGKLFSYAFYAPLYLLFILVSLIIVKEIGTTGLGTNDFGNVNGFFDALSGQGVSTYSVILTFVIITVFMILSVMVANKLSIKGGGAAISIGQKMAKGARGVAGRGLVRGTGLRKLAEKAEEKGYSRLARATGLSAAANAKFGSSRSAVDTEKAKRADLQARARSGQVSNIESAIETGTRSGATPDEKVAMERAIANASPEQLTSLLKKYKPGSPQHEKIAANMSASQYDSIMKLKGDEYDDEAKSKLTSSRSSSISRSLTLEGQNAHAAANRGAPPLSDADALRLGMANASAAQLKVLGGGTVATNAGGLTYKQLDELKKSTDFTETEKKRIIDANKKALNDDFNDPSKRAGVFRNKKDKDIAELPRDILTDPNAVEHLRGSALRKILEDGTLTDADRATIKTNLRAAGQGVVDPSVFNYLNSPHGQNF